MFTVSFDHSALSKIISWLLVIFGGMISLYAQDYDGDGHSDAVDNCMHTPNPDQADKNGNGVGDACEIVNFDSDGDGWPDNVDNCIATYNIFQFDYDSDGLGDYCDTEEGISDCSFSCVNNGYEYYNGSSFCGCVCPCEWGGDDCSVPCFLLPGEDISCLSCSEPPVDRDQDGISDISDNAPLVANASQTDTDSDGIGDASDNCYLVSNATQADSDSDGIGDQCEGLGESLPVILGYFRAECKSNLIHLTWATQQEMNNHYFVIDKSRDGRNFQEWRILEVNESYSDREKRYLLTDTHIYNQVFHYYRLRQVDFNGDSHILGIAVIDTRPKKELIPRIQICPNPIPLAHPLFVQIEDPFYETTKFYNLRIYDLKGKLRLSMSLQGELSTRQKFWVDKPSALTGGTYILELSSPFWQKSSFFQVKM